MEHETADRSGARGVGARETGGTAYVVAGCSAAAGAIHFAMIPAHASESLTEAIGFAVAAWFQIAVAALLVSRRATKGLLWATVAGNAALIGLWAWSRTAGLPFGSGGAESAHTIDTVCVILEAVAIVIALVMIASARSWRVSPVAAVIAGVSAVALATVVMVSPSASQHDHTHADLADATTSGHNHGGIDPAVHAAEMTQVESTRCDRALNPASYWTEAQTLGIDTIAGGAMTADMQANTSLQQAIQTSKLGGRGSEQLDKLVSLTSQANSEAAAGALVAQLGKATDGEYAAWLEWLRNSMAGTGGGHSHGTSSSSSSSAAPDDTQGHGGHLGPQPWKAMTNPADCDQLDAELERARKVTGKYPTAADATKAGWYKVTPYVPGIAAHYMNFSLVDDKFDIDKPEMLLYDGSGPDAHIVGLSYYMVLPGSAEPTQGFTGDNDHYHRHIGLCVSAAGVIGDSTTTEEQCRAMGGVKQNGDAGWMQHTWVVPGCESPWGMFSGANPLLDGKLAEQSGKNNGHCSASGVRHRYNLDAGSPAPEAAVTGAAAGP